VQSAVHDAGLTPGPSPALVMAVTGGSPVTAAIFLVRAGAAEAHCGKVAVRPSCVTVRAGSWTWVFPPNGM